MLSKGYLAQTHSLAALDARMRRRDTHASQTAQGFRAKKESMRLCVGSASASSTPTGSASTTTPRCSNFSLSTGGHRTAHSQPTNESAPQQSRRLRGRARGPPQTRAASRACPRPCRRPGPSRFGPRSDPIAPPPAAASFWPPGARTM